MLFCKETDLLNESDVEQKFILPMLTTERPLGLGFSIADFRTKTDLRQIKIDKGASEKIYYPDYLMIFSGLPLMVIEAKHPKENIESAIREARLYATEINAEFPKKINPCSKIIVSNGRRIICCSWDSSTKEIDLFLSEISVENEKYSNLIKFASKSTLSKDAQDILKLIRGRTVFQKPVRILGGNAVQNEEIPENTFGTSLALDYRHLFNPTTQHDRIDIVKNAYVASSRRQKHVEPIEKIIRAANPASITHARQIEYTEKPHELIKTLRQSQAHDILLLVGSVGSGKSTFIDYLQEVCLPEELKNDTIWVSIDLNTAPLSKEEIYEWLIQRITNELRNLHPTIDFDDLEIIKKYYSVELRKFAKGPLALFPQGSLEHNKLIAEKLFELLADTRITIRALIQYLCAERNKTLIVVLDNCDRRNRDDQLLMFDVAKWVQSEFECLVFLPMRDTTFDHHRKEPPLDTVIKDLAFRIDPPPLEAVIYKRVNYALRQMKLDGTRALSYELPNAMRVEYPQSEQGMYLACILQSLFQTDTFFRRLIAGIAGRDIRKGLEIFLDFCKSGYISTDEILKIRQSEGKYILPKHIVTRVLLRGSRKYYHDAGGHIRSLFFSLPEDTIPDPYVRQSILKWLSNRSRVPGPNGSRGYHQVGKLISNLTPYGHSEGRIRQELLNLSKAGCILTESQESGIIRDEDLITLSPSGHVHLDLLGNLDYLASCAEDLWYKDSEVASRIAMRISNQAGDGHLSFKTNIENAEDMINYLEKYRDMILSSPATYLEEGSYEKLIDDSESRAVIENSKKSILDRSELLSQQYPPGSIVDAEIVAIKPNGFFVEFGLNALGFMFISDMDFFGLNIHDFDAGDPIRVEIINYNKNRKRFKVKPARDISV